jgi:hypothetical protein
VEVARAERELAAGRLQVTADLRPRLVDATQSVVTEVAAGRGELKEPAALGIDVDAHTRVHQVPADDVDVARGRWRVDLGRDVVAAVRCAARTVVVDFDGVRGRDASLRQPNHWSVSVSVESVFVVHPAMSKASYCGTGVRFSHWDDCERNRASRGLGLHAARTSESPRLARCHARGHTTRAFPPSTSRGDYPTGRERGQLRTNRRPLPSHAQCRALTHRVGFITLRAGRASRLQPPGAREDGSNPGAR